MSSSQNQSQLALSLFSFTYEEHSFSLGANHEGKEVLNIDGKALESERPLQGSTELAIGHPSLGELRLKYRIDPEAKATHYQLLRGDVELISGENPLPAELQVSAAPKKTSHTVGFIGLFFKLFKSAKAVKILLAGSALAGWSILISWQFAVVIISVIVFHEYGHLWAMKRSGMKTKGMYLIPFVSGVAIGDKASSHWQQVFIAMMGPVFGLAMSLAFFAAYLVTENHFVGLVASISALVNVFNLLPVLPLDGGQVVKAMVFSGRSYWPYLGLMIISAAMFALALHFELALLGFFVAIGALDLTFSWREFKHQTVKPMDRYGVLFSLAWYLITLGIFIFMILAIAEAGLPGSEVATTILNS